VWRHKTPDLLGAIAHFERGRDDGAELHLGRRIEVEAHAVSGELGLNSLRRSD
jgi:hypothetical protein